MGLGPRLDIRQSQSLVMSQQLQAAIKLLALSNLELEAVVAEELAKNPLLESSGGDGETVVITMDRETGDQPAEPSGADELLAKGDDSGLDMDWREAALDNDSLSDVGGSGGGADEAFDFDRLAGCESGLCEHLMDQLHGAGELDYASVQQELLGERGLAGVGVRDDRERAAAGDFGLEPGVYFGWGFYRRCRGVHSTRVLRLEHSRRG